MVLVGEDEKLCLDALHACCIEGRHSLCGVDAVVLLSVDAEYRGVPLVDETMWRVLVGLTCIVCLVLVPVSVVVFPVGEPILLGLGVHCFEVESTVMSYETLEALVVMTCEIVHAEATERSTYGT